MKLTLIRCFTAFLFVFVSQFGTGTSVLIVQTEDNSIYIAADSRGTGVGGTLLRALIDECTARDFRQMVALIGDSTNAASVRLHKAAGLSLVGTLKSVGYKHGRWLDVVLMQRALGPGDSRTPRA